MVKKPFFEALFVMGVPAPWGPRLTGHELDAQGPTKSKSSDPFDFAQGASSKRSGSSFHRRLNREASFERHKPRSFLQGGPLNRSL